MRLWSLYGRRGGWVGGEEGEGGSRVKEETNCVALDSQGSRGTWVEMTVCVGAG